MQEEVHGINEPRQYKLLYGWGAINASVWLPSLSELVGIDPNNYHEGRGCYFSAMQGLNTSGPNYYVDAQGGSQFAYFKQYNVSGGKDAIRAACNQQACWLRSPDYAQTQHVTSTLENGNVSTYVLVTRSYAVHPAVLVQAKI